MDLQWRWDCKKAPNKKLLVWSREKMELFRKERELFRKERNDGHKLVIPSPAQTSCF